MKKIQKILAVLFSLAVSAGSYAVPLTWDPSLTPGCSYILIASTNSLNNTNWQSAPIRMNVGTNTVVHVTDISGTWSFAAVATKEGIHSDISNVLTLEVPTPARSVRTVFVEYGITVTNFVDVGFFKLRIQ